MAESFAAKKKTDKKMNKNKKKEQEEVREKQSLWQ
jgi:hypothetical protein